MTENDAPRAVDAGRGISVLYKGRYLFSRYDPYKTLQKRLESFSVLPESLILCFSPVLPFVIDSIRNMLMRKNISGCFILGAEADEALYDFYRAQKKADVQTPHGDFPRTTDFSQTPAAENARDFCPDAAVLLNQVSDIARLLEGASFGGRYEGAKLPAIGLFKRVLVFEASGAAAFYKNFYAQSAAFAQNGISMFWKNIMTLVRLGRLFSRNVLKNAAQAAVSPPLAQASVHRPIFVAGAGPSLDALIPFIRRYAHKLYILAVDAAFRPLLDSGIRPDAVVAVESQCVSRRAFFGTKGSGVPIIADLCARSANLRVSGGTVSFFMSEYAKLPLLGRIKKTLPDVPVFPPLGSVGLAAVEAALFLRRTHESVFVCGLDFSYPAGLSHCKESPSYKEMMNELNRLSPAGNPSAAFKAGAFFIEGKDGSQAACDPALKSYAELFSARYKNTENLYDLSSSGIDLALPCISEADACSLMEAFSARTNRREPAAREGKTSSAAAKKSKSEQKSEKENANGREKIPAISAFYEEEKKRLQTLRAALTGEKPLDKADLKALLEECSYVYAHFPDARHGAVLSQNFLNRVRSEIDFFLKDIENTAAAASLDG